MSNPNNNEHPDAAEPQRIQHYHQHKTPQQTRRANPLMSSSSNSTNSFSPSYHQQPHHNSLDERSDYGRSRPPIGSPSIHPPSSQRRPRPHPQSGPPMISFSALGSKVRGDTLAMQALLNESIPGSSNPPPFLSPPRQPNRSKPGGSVDARQIPPSSQHHGQAMLVNPLSSPPHHPSQQQSQKQQGYPFAFSHQASAISIELQSHPHLMTNPTGTPRPAYHKTAPPPSSLSQDTSHNASQITHQPAGGARSSRQVVPLTLHKPTNQHQKFLYTPSKHPIYGQPQQHSHPPSALTTSTAVTRPGNDDIMTSMTIRSNGTEDCDALTLSQPTPARVISPLASTPVSNQVTNQVPKVVRSLYSRKSPPPSQQPYQSITSVTTLESSTETNHRTNTLKPCQDIPVSSDQLLSSPLSTSTLDDIVSSLENSQQHAQPSNILALPDAISRLTRQIPTINNLPAYILRTAHPTWQPHGRVVFMPQSTSSAPQDRFDMMNLYLTHYFSDPDASSDPSDHMDDDLVPLPSQQQQMAAYQLLPEDQLLPKAKLSQYHIELLQQRFPCNCRFHSSSNPAFHRQAAVQKKPTSRSTKASKKGTLKQNTQKAKDATGARNVRKIGDTIVTFTPKNSLGDDDHQGGSISLDAFDGDGDDDSGGGDTNTDLQLVSDDDDDDDDGNDDDDSSLNEENVDSIHLIGSNSSGAPREDGYPPTGSSRQPAQQRDNEHPPATYRGFAAANQKYVLGCWYDPFALLPLHPFCTVLPPNSASWHLNTPRLLESYIHLIQFIAQNIPNQDPLPSIPPAIEKVYASKQQQLMDMTSNDDIQKPRRENKRPANGTLTPTEKRDVLRFCHDFIQILYDRCSQEVGFLRAISPELLLGTYTFAEGSPTTAMPSHTGFKSSRDMHTPHMVYLIRCPFTNHPWYTDAKTVLLAEQQQRQMELMLRKIRLAEQPVPGKKSRQPRGKNAKAKEKSTTTHEQPLSTTQQSSPQIPDHWSLIDTGLNITMYNAILQHQASQQQLYSSMLSLTRQQAFQHSKSRPPFSPLTSLNTLPTGMHPSSLDCLSHHSKIPLASTASPSNSSNGSSKQDMATPYTNHNAYPRLNYYQQLLQLQYINYIDHPSMLPPMMLSRETLQSLAMQLHIQSHHNDTQSRIAMHSTRKQHFLVELETYCRQYTAWLEAKLKQEMLCNDDENQTQTIPAPPSAPRVIAASVSIPITLFFWANIKPTLVRYIETLKAQLQNEDNSIPAGSTHDFSHSSGVSSHPETTPACPNTASNDDIDKGDAVGGANTMPTPTPLHLIKAPKQSPNVDPSTSLQSSNTNPFLNSSVNDESSFSLVSGSELGSPPHLPPVQQTSLLTPCTSLVSTAPPTRNAFSDATQYVRLVLHQQMIGKSYDQTDSWSSPPSHHRPRPRFQKQPPISSTNYHATLMNSYDDVACHSANMLQQLQAQCTALESLFNSLSSQQMISTSSQPHPINSVIFNPILEMKRELSSVPPSLSQGSAPIDSLVAGQNPSIVHSSHQPSSSSSPPTPPSFQSFLNYGLPYSTTQLCPICCELITPSIQLKVQYISSIFQLLSAMDGFLRLRTFLTRPKLQVQPQLSSFKLSLPNTMQHTLMHLIKSSKFSHFRRDLVTAYSKHGKDAVDRSFINILRSSYAEILANTYEQECDASINVHDHSMITSVAQPPQDASNQSSSSSPNTSNAKRRRIEGNDDESISSPDVESDNTEISSTFTTDEHGAPSSQSSNQADHPRTGQVASELSSSQLKRQKLLAAISNPTSREIHAMIEDDAIPKQVLANAKKLYTFLHKSFD